MMGLIIWLPIITRECLYKTCFAHCSPQTSWRICFCVRVHQLQSTASCCFVFTAVRLLQDFKSCCFTHAIFKLYIFKRVHRCECELCSVSVCQPCDWLANGPGCTLPPVQCQLGLPPSCPRPCTGEVVQENGWMEGWIFKSCITLLSNLRATVCPPQSYGCWALLWAGITIKQVLRPCACRQTAGGFVFIIHVSTWRLTYSYQTEVSYCKELLLGVGKISCIGPCWSKMEPVR